MRLKRMWVNQPSTLQPDHKLHGTCVLADFSTEFKRVIDVYFLSGPAHSQRIAILSLSEGWPEHLINKVDNSKPFTHHIDLNERGVYKMHVENPNGEVVFAVSSEDSEDGKFWPTEDGFMKHADDMDGLEKYLKEMGWMPDDAKLINKH